MTDEERRKRLEDRAMRNYREAMTSGGGSRSTGLYQMAMYAGLVVFTTLGWRILAELGRIRRRLT